MNCTPEKCPHRALVEKARAACLACDHTSPSGHGGVASYDAMGERLVEREKAAFRNEPRGQVTSLPPEVEERTAELYRVWCGLDTIDALLLLHVSNGGTCATFGAYLSRVHDTIGRMEVARGSFRATAWAKFQRLIRRFAPYLRGKLHSWDDGHGGAVRRERVSAELEARQGDLFQWQGGETPGADRGVGTPGTPDHPLRPGGEVSKKNIVT